MAAKDINATFAVVAHCFLVSFSSLKELIRGFSARVTAAKNIPPRTREPLTYQA